MENKILQMNWQVKVLDEVNRIIEMVGSDESFDRVGDKMIMAGADLSNYKKNPVIIANHNYGYTEKPSVIGRALDVNIVGSKMVFKIQFAETDNGKEWFYLYSNKYMNASSIGFIPKEYKPNDQGGYDFIKWELLELSMVAVPCNPNAIQRAFTEGHISKALFDLINKSEEDTENMKKEEVEALISKAVDDKVKTLEIKHADEIAELKAKLAKAQPQKGTGPNCTDCAGGQCDGCCCCECDKSTCKGCDKTPNPDKSFHKSGASISSRNAEIIKSVMDGMTEHIKSLKALIDVTNTQETDGDGDNGDSKDYTEEEIQKMVAEKIEKMMKEAK